MRKYNRIFLIVLDSLGIGAMADSEKFGDVGVNTFGHIWESQGGLEIPNLRRLGMGNLCGVTEDEAKGYARRLNEASNGKDTMTGHWEMMGIYTTKPFVTFTDHGFPKELIDELEKRTGRKIIGNKAASGTEILDELAEREIENGELIVYTSADSVLQICGNEETMGLETLYHYCEIARELNISGPFNIQYLARENDIKVIECNLRASRSFPFVSKVLKINLIELATKVMLGIPVQKPDKNLFDLDYVGIKASQFSFNRLQKADPVLGVDMASTGEVGCIGSDTSCAILKAMLSVGYRIPEKNILLSTGTPKQKVDMLSAARMLQKKGYKIFATGGSSNFLTENGVENTRVYWPSEPERQPQALDMLHRKEIDMVVNIPKNLTAGELDNGYKIRRAAIDLNIPLITNARLASAFINAFCTMMPDDLAIKSWAEYK